VNRTYRIVRFRIHGPREVIVTGMTLKQAQAWCQREDTHGDGWFDGYEYDDERTHIMRRDPQYDEHGG
jgi:hypothetical protein